MDLWERGDDDRDVEPDHQVAGGDEREDGRAAHDGHGGRGSPYSRGTSLSVAARACGLTMWLMMLAA